MAGRKPLGRGRLMVRIRAEDRATVDRVAELSGKSRALVIGELIDATMPVVREQLAAMEKVARSPEEAAKVIAELAQYGIATIAQAQLDFHADDKQGAQGGRRKRA